jgi:Cof subfamily protein (haloacid dehalogenase superfamily)
MIQLIGIDIDGTLLDSAGRMPEANGAAVHAAVAAGIQVALVTGRSYPFARPILETLPREVTLIVSNGAVERTRDGRTLARRLLDRRIARSVLAATTSHRESAALIFDRDAAGQMVFENMDWAHPGRKAYWARNQAFIAQSVPLDAALTEDPIQVMFSGAAGPMRALSDWLRQECFDVAVLLTEYVHRDFSLVDVTAPAATKGQALASRARELGLAADEVMAVGDNFNDLDMLEFAGTPVVMGNAAEALKTRGWHVTAGHDDAGLAEAITRFALSGRSGARTAGRAAP